MTYEEQAQYRAMLHADNWKDEQLTWWDQMILELPDRREDETRLDRQQYTTL